MFKAALAAAILALALAGSTSAATPSLKTARFAPKRIVMLPHIKEFGQLAPRTVSER